MPTRDRGMSKIEIHQHIPVRTIIKKKLYQTVLFISLFIFFILFRMMLESTRIVFDTKFFVKFILIVLIIVLDVFYHFGYYIYKMDFDPETRILNVHVRLLFPHKMKTRSYPVMKIKVEDGIKYYTNQTILRIWMPGWRVKNYWFGQVDLLDKKELETFVRRVNQAINGVAVK